MHARDAYRVLQDVSISGKEDVGWDTEIGVSQVVVHDVLTRSSWGRRSGSRRVAGDVLLVRLFFVDRDGNKSGRGAWPGSVNVSGKHDHHQVEKAKEGHHEGQRPHCRRLNRHK